MIRTRPIFSRQQDELASINLSIRCFRVLPYLLVLVIPLLAACTNQPASRPNVIIILADDMGYSDLGCMGSEISTPHLDRLASNGLLYTQFYNTARCSPSRASLLTGLYPHKAGVAHLDDDLGFPAYQGYLKEGVATLPEVLQANGYRTLFAGKWHVGTAREHWPDRKGFEQFYGIPKGGGLYFYPSPFIDREVYKNGEKVIPDSATFYSTDNFTDEAIQMIGEGQPNDKPFFLYLAYIAPHFPLQAPAEDIAKYRGTYRAGYAHTQQRRFERQKELGIVDASTALPTPEFTPWEDVEDKEREDLKMATYAAQVDRMDRNIGKLVRFLEKTGQLENTVILFLSDNGACAQEINRSGEAGIGTAASFVSYGKNWANVSNTPYRKYKRQTHEGGIKTPLIVHWPGGIVERGVIRKEVAHIKDLMPTVLELANIRYADNNQAAVKMDGRSFAYTLNNPTHSSTETLFWEHEGNSSIRTGDWKLVRLNHQPWELYNLEENPVETHNLAEEECQRVDSLKTVFSLWSEEVGVKAWPVK